VRQLSIGSGPAATLVVVGDPDNPIPTLVQNVDPLNTVYLGESAGINPAQPNSCAPLAPGQTSVASGDINVFAIAAPGQTVAVNVYRGLMSFFQPISQLAIAGPTAAILIYTPSAGPGNLVGSWSGASTPYLDQYNNVVNPGLNAAQGTLASMILQAATSYNETLYNPIVNSETSYNPEISGGTITETAIVFDTGGGSLLMYASTTTTVTFSTAGRTAWVAPVSGTADVRVWGSDAGAGGGSQARGGEGGGGGEFAEEPNYQIVAGQTYQIDVGRGGTGGNTGVGGTSGGDSGFDSYAVLAGGGQAGSGFVGGQGGNKSSNTRHFKGGNGGGDNTQSTGGCGGGGRAGINGPGGNGAKSSGSGGAAGGAAGSGTGGIAGANGGAAAANGNNGPAGAGGCGAATQAATGNNSYYLRTTTYYGSDASGGNANGQRIFEGTPFYHGGETASGGSYNGTQKTLGVINGNPQSDLSGKTIDSVTLQLTCQHTWYNSGMTVYFGYNGRSTEPSTWDGSDITSIGSANATASGNPVVYDLSGLGLGSAMQSGAAKSVTFGPGSGSFNLQNYGYFSGWGSGQGPLLTVNWHTGSQPVKAGNGGNGLVTVTYVNSQALIGALSPVAGSDSVSNAFAAGYTGAVQAIQPSSSPAAVETWHNVTPPSGWSGVNRYKKVAEANCAMVDIQCTHAGASGNVTFMTLPAAYSPVATKSTIPSIGNNSAPANSNQRIDVNTNGNVTTFALPASTTQVKVFFIYPLD
jgi:hypothetical protein